MDNKGGAATALNLICPEREYLEKVYIDFLRRQYPTLETFRAFAASSFAERKLRNLCRVVKF